MEGIRAFVTTTFTRRSDGLMSLDVENFSDLNVVVEFFLPC